MVRLRSIILFVINLQYLEPFGNLSNDSSTVNLVASSGSAKEGSGDTQLIDTAQYEKLKLDLKLKEADNKFLQDELEAKDQMLSMLTEGLKEVMI